MIRMENASYFNWIFETITKHTLDIIIIVDQNRRVLFETPMLYEIFGLSPDEVAKMDIFDIVYSDDREYMMARHRSLLSTQKASSTEYRIVDKFRKIRHSNVKQVHFPTLRIIFKLWPLEILQKGKQWRASFKREKIDMRFFKEA